MLVVGLMSGTSVDGIDAALCEIQGAPPRLCARILHGLTVPYDAAQRARILAACRPDTSGVDAICRLHAALGEWLAEAALRVIAEAGLHPSDVDLIGSHGQTVWHDVCAEGRVTATLQLGEAAVIAERTGITTVSNLRARDVAAGGQGAPLTGYVDWLLLRHARHWRAVQNIGGMANVTFLPPLSLAEALPLAFDTGPGNALIDGAVAALSNGQLAYDRDGAWAARGAVCRHWLEELLAHPYFRREPPKTTGRELFGQPLAHALVERGSALGLAPADIVATLTALTAASIADAYRRFAPAPMGEVIVGGGGRHNRTLLTMLQQQLPESAILSHEAIGLDGDFKEALVFAVLACETWHGRPGAHPAITGAQRPTVLGQITPGDNYGALSRERLSACGSRRSAGAVAAAFHQGRR
jgi:anhydro-N-acetylmuramic acid kinase